MRPGPFVAFWVKISGKRGVVWARKEDSGGGGMVGWNKKDGSFPRDQRSD